ncbi:TPA: hypothetical protein ACSTLU_004336 [Serratia fonticola]
MTTEVILSQQIAGINCTHSKNVKKASTQRNPFICGDNVTGIALEFYIRNLQGTLLPRTACDFLSKICNVAAASGAYRLYYSKNTMAEKTGVSPRTVQRYMRIIEASGIVTRTVVTDSIKGHQPNLYTFTHEFIAAVRAFFTVHLGDSQIKNIRKIPHCDLQRLVELSLAPIRGLIRKVSKLKDICTNKKVPPIGQNDASPTGQSDLQKEVTISGKAVEQNLAGTPGPDIETASQGKTLSGTERRALTNSELIAARKKREAEAAELTRAAHKRKQMASFLQRRSRGYVAKKAQDAQTQYNHTRIVEEGRRHDEALAKAQAGAQKDATVIHGHLNAIRALFGKKPIPA